MVYSGSTVVVMVSGSYGAFAGLSGQSDATQALNNLGYSVNDWSENDPSLVSQVMDGNFLSHVYQSTVTATLGKNYNSLSDIASEFGTAFGQALGTNPTAVAVISVDGVSTGQVQQTAQYGVTAATQALRDGSASIFKPIQDELNSILGNVSTVLIVVAIGAVLVLIFAPKAVKSVTGALGG